MEIAGKERLKSGTHSYHQERVLSRMHFNPGMCSKSSVV